MDLAVTGSRKGLMLPAGLGILAASPKAMEASRTATMRRACFDFGDMVKINADGYFPYTPRTRLVHGLRAALDRIFAEGLENVIARHHRLATDVRAGVAARGLKMAAEHPSLCPDTVTTIMLPEGADARDVIRIGYRDFNVSFGSGLGPLAGRAFRIGHLGDLDEGMALPPSPWPSCRWPAPGRRSGAGVAAAQAVHAEIPARATAMAAGWLSPRSGTATAGPPPR